MTYKLTIDSNLMDTSLAVAGMQELRRWRQEGKIEFVEANPPKTQAYGWPGAPPKPAVPSTTPGRYRKSPGKFEESGKATFNSIASVLFPARDPHKLYMAEINDVTHLIRHHASKNEIFVTANTKGFIEAGRRERLKSAFGIITMTPEETVRMLSELQGWEVEETRTPKVRSRIGK